jgi:hypothetical protein
MRFEAVEYSPSRPAMGTDQPIRHLGVAFLEGLSASRKIGRLKFHGERDVVTAAREDLVDRRGDIAEERIRGIGPGHERRRPPPPDIALDGARDAHSPRFQSLTAGLRARDS